MIEDWIDIFTESHTEGLTGEWIEEWLEEWTEGLIDGLDRELILSFPVRPGLVPRPCHFYRN
jgi:hypothetical protein